jgi:hypothetical protein
MWWIKFRTAISCYQHLKICIIILRAFVSKRRYLGVFGAFVDVFLEPHTAQQRNESLVGVLFSKTSEIAKDDVSVPFYNIPFT